MKPSGPRRPFVVIGGAEVDAATVRLGGLFLGRFTMEALQRALEASGLFALLAERGYPDVVVGVSVQSGEHRLRVRARGSRVPLVELRLAEGALPIGDERVRTRGLTVISCLSVNWLAVQDPRRAFPPDRLRLPGQRHPGLGLGRRMYTELLRWAAGWGKDAVLNHPAYFHNARFYASIFRFLLPEEQGRLEALARDLGELTVAEASAAVEEGRVRDEQAGVPFVWEPGPMVAPLTVPIVSWLDSPEYAQAMAAAREAARFSVGPESAA